MSKFILALIIAVTTGFFSISYAAHTYTEEAIQSLGAESITELINVLKSDAPEDTLIKIKAVQRLGELKATEGVPEIINALGYGSETIVKEAGGRKYYNWKIRVVSAKALADINDERSIIPLAKRALLDEDVIVQRASVQALGLMGEKAKNKTVLKYLYQALERTRDNGLVSDICETMAKIGDKNSFVYFLRVTQGPYLNYVKDIAQKGISQIQWDKPSAFDEDNKKSGSTVSPYNK